MERFVPSVLSLVSGQFVTASKSPSTVIPTADVRLLSSVGPEVCLQVGGLGVLLPTPRVLTGVSGGLALQHYHNLWVICRGGLEHLSKLLRRHFLISLTRGGGSG